MAPTRLSMNTTSRTYAVGGLLAAGTAAAAAAIWTTVPSSVLANAETIGILRGLLIASWVAAGAYMWSERPESRLGLLLAGAGLVYALTSLMASSDQLTYTAGRIALAAFVVFFAYVYLCFPGDRVVADLNRRFITGFALASVAVWPFVLAFSDRLPEGGALNACSDPCPANALRVASVSDRISDSLNAIVGVVTTVGLLGTAALLVSNARSPARLRRRAVEPVVFAYAILVVSYLANAIGDLSGGALDAAQVAAATGAFLTPVAMLAGQARARSYASVAAGQLVTRGQAERMTRARLQEWLRDALGDPTLEVAFWDRLRLGFVDIDGNLIEWADASPGRAVTPVNNNGRPFAVIAHSASLQEANDVVDGLAQTALILLENARLVDELRASRARIVASADQERHRLERDLHDGAQQRLVALTIDLGLASERIDQDPGAAKELILEGQAQAREALAEIRQLVRGIAPAILLDRGLVPALDSIIGRGPVRTTLASELAPGARFSPAVERAAYFVVSEALANVAKHSNAKGCEIRLRLEEQPSRRLIAEVRDDGHGGAQIEPEGGLAGLASRVAAVDGTFSVSSPAGGPTLVRAEIPLA